MKSPMSNKAKKSPKGKGTVSIESFQERLRLRWRFAGKRYVLSIGLPDSKINRQVAHQKAMMIELDMASGNFDCSLKKYKPYVQDTSSVRIQVGGLDKETKRDNTKSCFNTIVILLLPPALCRPPSLHDCLLT